MPLAWKLRWVSGACAVLVAACVRVPDSIKAEFRAAEPDERSNYQPGLHGQAPPADASDPWSRWVAAQASDAGVAEAADSAAAPVAAETTDAATAPTADAATEETP